MLSGLGCTCGSRNQWNGRDASSMCLGLCYWSIPLFEQIATGSRSLELQSPYQTYSLFVLQKCLPLSHTILVRHTEWLLRTDCVRTMDNWFVQCSKLSTGCVTNPPFPVFYAARLKRATETFNMHIQLFCMQLTVVASGKCRLFVDYYFSGSHQHL